MHDDPWADYSSYWFSRLNLRTNYITGLPYHGISGRKISSIRNQVKTLMVVDQPGCFAYSWHKPEAITDPGPNEINESWNMGVFVDAAFFNRRLHRLIKRKCNGDLLCRSPLLEVTGLCSLGLDALAFSLLFVLKPHK